MARGIGNALGSFAQGAMQGYQMQLAKQRQEKLDAQAAKEAQLRMANLERAGKVDDLRYEQLQRDDAKRKQVEELDARIRTGAMARVEETAVPGKKEGEVEQVFRVGDQSFASRAAADAELKRLNNPVALAKRQYQMAAEAGMPELADRYRNQLNQTREEAKAHLQESAMEALRAGPWAVNKLYNDSVMDGRTEQLTQGPNGELVVAYYQGGKRVSDPVTFKSQDEYISSHLQRFRTNPDAYLDNWTRERQFKEGQRQFNEEMTWKKEHGAATLGVQRLSAQAAQTGAAASMASATRPQFIPLTSPDGQTTQVVATGVGPKGALYSTPVGEPMTGIRGVPRPAPPKSATEQAMEAAAAKKGGMGTGTFDLGDPNELFKRLNAMQPGAQ